MVLVPKVPNGTLGTNYSLVATNEQALPVILQEEGSGPSGPTPLSAVKVVDGGGPTGPAGDGSFSGNLAFSGVQDAVNAAPGGVIWLAPGNYSGTITWTDVALSFSGQTAVPSDTQLQDLQPSSTGGAIELHLQNLATNVIADFAALGALRVHAENADVGVSGAPDNVEVFLTNCFVNQPIDAASITIRNCTFGFGAALTGSVSIDAQSWETAVQTVGPSIFPSSTTILGTLTGQTNASAIAVADDGSPHDVIILDHPGAPLTGFTSIMQAGLAITPDNPADTPFGLVTLTDPDAGSTSIAWGPIPAGDSVYVPFSRFGTGAGNWTVSVIVAPASGDVSVDATLLLVKS